MTQFGEPAFVAPEAADRQEEKEDKGTESVRVRFSLFFDGTLNNRTNINALKDKRKEATRRGENPDNEELIEHADEGSSYDSELTNVAKMEQYIGEDAAYGLTLHSYIEGAGTEDNEGDAWFGYALGVFSTGVRAKVEKAVHDVVSKVTQNVEEALIIELLTLDVFGFSRGAAGARNFIYEVLNGDELEPIKALLADKGYTVKKVEVCFAGLYDTVSSHGIVYSNDISDLNLRAVRKAKKVIQLSASDEHRENFTLTSIQSAGYKGREIFLPGVHSDIGGGYKDGITEKLKIFNGTETAAIADRKNLIAAGWFKEDEITLMTYADEFDEYDMYASLDVTRPTVANDPNKEGLTNTYSRIPLHIMARFARETEINIKSKIDRDEKIPGALSDVKQRIDKYITDTDPDTSKRKSSIGDWHHNDGWLRDLRHDFLHFSAKWTTGLKPRFSGRGIRHRKTYNG